jgi:hypothetical protein
MFDISQQPLHSVLRVANIELDVSLELLTERDILIKSSVFRQKVLVNTDIGFQKVLPDLCNALLGDSRHA